MKTTFTVTAKDLADLLSISSHLHDDSWKLTDWILDVLGTPPESSQDWNALTKAERDSGWTKDGFALCCRDAFHDMHSDKELNRENALEIISSWIQANHLAEQPRAPK